MQRATSKLSPQQLWAERLIDSHKLTAIGIRRHLAHGAADRAVPRLRIARVAPLTPHARCPTPSPEISD